MGISRTEPADWMKKQGSNKIGQPFGTERGWEITHPDGTTELLAACHNVAEATPVAPVILNVDNPDSGEYSASNGDKIVFKVVFSEPVTVDETGGTPSISFEINSTPQEAQYEASKSSSTVLVFEYSVIPEIQGTFGNVTQQILGNGANIKAQDDGVTDAVLTFPSDYKFESVIKVVS